MGKIIITKEEIKRLYLEEKKSLCEIAIIANCNFTNIRAHLNRMGVTKRNLSDAGRKYELNEDVFEKIDNEYKAYFLGYLYADGYNQVTKNQIRLTLHEKDVKILERFLEFLETDRPLLKLRKTYYDVSINSVKMSRDLENLGCMQKKSLILKFPTEEQVPRELQHHFIRGYFDGDGCFSIRDRKNRPSNTYQFTLMGTYDMLYNIQKILVQHCNISNIKIHQRNKVYLLIYSGKQNFIKIGNYLYNNSNIYLERKHNKYLSTFTQ